MSGFENRRTHRAGFSGTDSDDNAASIASEARRALRSCGLVRTQLVANDYTASAGDLVRVDSTSAVEVMLPAPTSIVVVSVYRAGSGSVTVRSLGDSVAIDGAASDTIGSTSGALYISTGTEWFSL